MVVNYVYVTLKKIGKSNLKPVLVFVSLTFKVFQLQKIIDNHNEDN